MTGMLMGLSVANVTLSIALQFAAITILGAGQATDAYFAAQTVPVIIGAIVSGALINNLTPVAAGLDTGRADAFVRATMFQFALLGLAVFGILSMTAKWWIPVLFPGFDRDGANILVTLAQIFCAGAAVQALSSIGIAGRYARHEFVFVEVIQMLATIAVLACSVPIIKKFGILGFVLLLQVRNVGILVITSTRFVIARRIDVHDLTTELWGKVRQILSASVIFKMGSVIDRMLASFSPSGVITALGVGQQVVSASLGVSDRVLARPLLANSGALLSANASQEVLRMYYHQSRIFMIAAGACLLVAAPIALVVLQSRMVFGVIRTDLFGPPDLIVLMVLTIIPAALSQLSSSLMYGLGDVVSINRIAITSFTLSALLKIIGFMYFGGYAIIAGIFLYQGFNWYFLHRAAIRKLRQIDT